MIYKAPHTDTEVPWHQDQGYWLDMPDKRALSCWVCCPCARDNATHAARGALVAHLIASFSHFE